MTSDEWWYERVEMYKELIDYDSLRFWTPKTLKEELDWAMRAGGCHACGTVQPDCEMTWEVDEEELLTAHVPGIDLRGLCRPRLWFCASDTETLNPRVLCASCYRIVRYECVEGVWVPNVMTPYRLQMILPFRESIHMGDYKEEQRVEPKSTQSFEGFRPLWSDDY